MQYRHGFHAGNFADVHKHVALIALLDRLTAKAKGFLFLDTHAAAGLFDLRGEEARRGDEWQGGIGRLDGLAGTVQAPELRRYLEVVQSLRTATGTGTHAYPGSPLIAAQVLRDVDRGVFVEARAQEARALERALARLRPAAKLRVEIADGFELVRALLPPVQRRGLVLIDPPYEQEDEAGRALEAMQQGLERFDTGVLALWFPLKRERDAELFLARVARTIAKPALALMLWLHPRDTAVGLNGSGLVVVNPPWRFDAAATAWQEELRQLLGGDAGSSCEVRWLVREQEAG